MSAKAGTAKRCMTKGSEIIELGQWLSSPAGRCLLEWEQKCLDRATTDAFGYHALQLGLPGLEGLRANRMPHRWVASDSMAEALPLDLPAPPDESLSTISPEMPVALRCEFDALPFPEHSIDLAVLPHTLELARDPHLALAEVERVLVPEGRVVITCLNPASAWALRQRAGRAVQGLGLGRGRPLYLPRTGAFLAYRRLRDWLRLLGFEVESAAFGVWQPPVRSERWLQRWKWIEPVGRTWWPVLGAAYCVQAVKRVRGMRLVGVARGTQRTARRAAALVAQREGVTTRREGM